ncbi:MAG: hypothetical protein AB7W16_23415 [Candidatus Obscuribacterales bacterium]
MFGRIRCGLVILGWVVVRVKTIGIAVIISGAYAAIISGFCQAGEQHDRPIPCYEPVVIERHKNGTLREYSLVRLSKVSRVSICPLLLLRISFDGKAIINPQGDEYPTTMPLANLSYQDALFLFGQPKDTKDGIKVFSLALAQSSEPVYQLETKFTGGRLRSYRVVGRAVHDQSWIVLKKEGREG